MFVNENVFKSEIGLYQFRFFAVFLVLFSVGWVFSSSSNVSFWSKKVRGKSR
ncbi:hypothetical protein NT03LS_2216 [Listeria seeligeri FSL N1-067]|uniref:Uncharacterized protein n=1 Tax=Listeria seeligeri FSL N1-067 TaxID=702453 RepID=E3ZRT8_LISSE|nr:hypothetical protein NT03LS_2216 [Listeria seeligeri FSL N1-067]CBH28018.1 hypothetical protein lse_1867 [Listeria seeligeri serovar 1/2b str. SLCC3954]